MAGPRVFWQNIAQSFKLPPMAYCRPTVHPGAITSPVYSAHGHSRPCDVKEIGTHQTRQTSSTAPRSSSWVDSGHYRHSDWSVATQSHTLLLCVCVCPTQDLAKENWHCCAWSFGVTCKNKRESV